MDRQPLAVAYEVRVHVERRHRHVGGGGISQLIAVQGIAHSERTRGNKLHAGGRAEIKEPVGVQGIGGGKLNIVHPIGSSRQGGNGLDGIGRTRLRVAPDQRAIPAKFDDGRGRRAGNLEEMGFLPGCGQRAGEEHSRARQRQEERQQFQEEP